MRVSGRTILSVATLLLIVVLIWAVRHELAQAWTLTTQVNLWILALIIPVLLLNYYSAGEMIFSYLRQKGSIKHVSGLEQMRMSLEMNFVNHALPSGGASGVSYMTWRLSKYGVSTSRAAMAQVVRFAAGFAAFSILLVVAVLLVTVDGGVNRWVILVSSTLVSLMIGATVIAIYALRSKVRLRTASVWISRIANRLTRKITGGRKQSLIRQDTLEAFFLDMHGDYKELRRDGRILKQPFLWGVVFTCTDVAMYFIAFWSLGSIVNPAPILLAYGLATLAGFVVLTPGGSGAYEALMVSFLTISGLAQGIAIAGVVLARVLILVVIIALGYVFYQLAIVKYGKKPDGNAKV